MQLTEKFSGFFKKLRENRVFQFCANKYVLVTIVALIILMIDHNGILTLWQNRRNIARQQDSIEKYRRDIANIEARIKSLTSNRDTIEALAREEYYYHKDNEDVFIVE